MFQRHGTAHGAYMDMGIQRPKRQRKVRIAGCGRVPRAVAHEHHILVGQPVGWQMPRQCPRRILHVRGGGQEGCAHTAPHVRRLIRLGGGSADFFVLRSGDGLQRLQGHLGEAFKTKPTQCLADRIAFLARLRQTLAHQRRGERPAHGPARETGAHHAVKGAQRLTALGSARAERHQKNRPSHAASLYVTCRLAARRTEGAADAEWPEQAGAVPSRVDQRFPWG